MSREFVGQTIGGRFEVQRSIGEGAMGSVYVATDQDGREVALKVLKSVDDGLRGPERFVREVKLLNRLVHPNVVEFVDCGQDERRGVLFLAMELIQGDPISRLVEHGRCSPSLALMVARQAAEGIDAAHDLGIVHRDIKPANLMLIPRFNGSVRVKVLDFGLAFVQEERRLTDMGTAPGTVSYMSPEQLQGLQVDRRADLYALGVVLFEMLTGRKPFPGSTQVEIAVSVLERTAPRLDAIVPEVPPGLADIVASLLEKDRRNRPQTSDDLVDAIAAFQRSSSLRPLRVTHRGIARDPRTAWGLVDAIDLEMAGA